MPSSEVFEALLKKGYPVDLRPFEKFDSIATNKDLDHLFSLLSRFKDVNGRHPVITANIITANPDFVGIKKRNFSEYTFEPFTETLKTYSNVSFETWQQGINQQLFFPQLHGREHLNVFSWLKSLEDANSEEREVFEYGLMGIPLKKNPNAGNVHQIAFNLDFNQKSTLEFVSGSITDAQDIFYKSFGYQAKSFISPVYTWDSKIEYFLKKVGVEAMQGGRVQLLPLSKKGIKHYTGEISSKSGMLYLVRNAFFEPSTVIDYNKRSQVLHELKKQTELIFQLKRPLVISMHRLNFVGRIFEINRNVNLELLENYLKWLLSKYSDIEFMTTVELLESIQNENCHP